MNEQEPPMSGERDLFDPYEGSRHMPWMDRNLSPSARAARMLRPELESFAVIEGREANGADLDAMSGRISADMVEILRREWAADVVNEWLEEKDAAREGRPIDPSIGPKAQPIGGDPRDTSLRVFVAEPEDIDWVMDRLGRQRAPFGSRRKPTRPGTRRFPPPPPPIAVPEPTPQPGGSLMTPADAETPASPPPFPAAEPPPPIPPTVASKPLLPDFEALIPPDLQEIFRPIPGSEVIPEGDQPFYIPGPSIGDPGRLVPVHIFRNRVRSKGPKSLGISGLIDPDELIAKDPVYGQLEELARRAADMVGPGKGKAYGTRVHKVFADLVKEEVRAKRLPPMETEFTYGVTQSPEDSYYSAPGSLRVDVHREMPDKSIRVYELKTGGAELKDERIDRTLDRKYFENRDSVTIMELNPWRLPRK